jgi:hypothetical protein
MLCSVLVVVVLFVACRCILRSEWRFLVFECVLVANWYRRIERACWAMLAQRLVKRVARLINCDRNWYDTSRYVFWCVVAGNCGSRRVCQADREVLLADSRRTLIQLQSSLVRH